MPERIVTDIYTQKTYALQPEAIGEGATAKVWLGTDTSNQRHQVAVKIAYRGMSPAALAAFWEEVRILQTLAATESAQAVTWAHKGQASDDPDLPVIVMEYIPPAWQLSRAARTAGGRLPERLALQSGLQYARLLVALHQARITQRGDRKLEDLRWDPTAQRLVVLDWNRARFIPGGASLDTERGLISQDIRGFGQLWAELVLGHLITELPAADNESDPAWADLSRGFRQILAKSHASRPAWGYQRAGELADALAHHIHWANQAAKAPAVVIDEAEKRRARADDATGVVTQADLADEALTLLDLVRRAEHSSEVIEASTQALSAWARTRVSVVMQTAAEAVKQIKGQWRLQDYETAAHIAQDALAQMHGGQPDAHIACLVVARWLWAAQAAVLVNDLGKELESAASAALRESVERLEEAVAANTPAAYASAAAAIDRAMRGLLEPAARHLQPFRQELNLRRHLANPTTSPEALEDWRALSTGAREYADYLRPTLPKLEALLSGQAVDQALSEDLESRWVGFAEAMTDLRLSLRASQEQPELDLTVELLTARRAAEEVALAGGDLSDNQDLHLVSALDDINDSILRRDHVDALDRAGRLSSRGVGAEDAALVLSRIRSLALAAVQAIYDVGRWPNELRLAQAILAGLARTDALVADSEIAGATRASMAAARASLAEHFSEWDAILTRSRLQLSELRGAEVFVNDPTWLVEHFERGKADEILENAAQLRMEIFDRGDLPEKQAAFCAVDTLLSARRITRMAAHVESLRSDLSRFQHEVDEWVVNAGQALERMHDLVKTYEDVSETIADSDYAGQIRGLQQQLADLAVARDNLARHAQEWPRLKQLAASLLGDASETRSQLEQVDQVIAEVTTANGDLKRVTDEFTQEHRRIEGLLASLPVFLATLDKARADAEQQAAEVDKTRLIVEAAAHDVPELQRRLAELTHEVEDVEQTLSERRRSLEGLAQSEATLREKAVRRRGGLAQTADEMSLASRDDGRAIPGGADNGFDQEQLQALVASEVTAQLAHLKQTAGAMEASSTALTAVQEAGEALVQDLEQFAKRRSNLQDKDIKQIEDLVDRLWKRQDISENAQKVVREWVNWLARAERAQQLTADWANVSGQGNLPRSGASGLGVPLDRTLVFVSAQASDLPASHLQRLNQALAEAFRLQLQRNSAPLRQCTREELVAIMQLGLLVGRVEALAKRAAQQGPSSFRSRQNAQELATP